MISNLYSNLVSFKELNEQQVQALADFTRALARYFPWDNENTRRFLKRINQWMQDRRSLKKLPVSTLKAILKAGSEGFLPVMQPYISCRESGQGLRGYPCSLWLLFHVLTVREYGVQKEKMAGGQDHFQHLVLPAMRSYIASFFSCAECAEHFGQESVTLQDELHGPADSVLWLWNMHNRVNERLAGQPSEDPAHPKRQFPPKQLCGSCRNHQSWNRNEVLQFMLRHYSHTELHRAGKVRYSYRGGRDVGVDLTFDAGSKFKKNGKPAKDGFKSRKGEASQLSQAGNNGFLMKFNRLIFILSILVKLLVQFS